jgi:hypothetical protein
MKRNFGTDRNGVSFSDETKLYIWNKARIIPDKDSKIYRKDICGSTIKWDKYGDTTENGFGWKIYHIKPIAKGGTDDLNNLQAL